MTSKNSGLTASGKAQPEFMRGDIYRDKYGGIVTIISVRERRIAYRREGYDYDCVMPLYQFARDFLWCSPCRAVSQPATQKQRRTSER